MYNQKEIAEDVAFHSMKVTGKCDSGCGKPATKWFGNTSSATCDDAECIAERQRRYNEFKSQYDEDD